MQRATPPTTLSLIGNTPLVPVHCFDTGVCSLYLKLESQNPGGSIKDRMALTMIEDAERSGKIKPGSTLVEATAGNTGIGLALVAAVKGYKLILVIPDKMSPEKIAQWECALHTIAKASSPFRCFYGRSVVGAVVNDGSNVRGHCSPSGM